MARKKSRKKGSHRKSSKRKTGKRRAKRRSSTKKARRGGGHIPLPILEKRAGKLVRLVHKRGGKVK